MQCGTTNLSRNLNSILVESIRDALPALRAKLEEAIASRRKELRMYGETPPGNTNAARGALLLTVLDSYATRFSAMLDGHGEHLPITELAGGARIRHIFQEIFTAGLDTLDPTAELSDEDVRTAIKNSGGIKGSLLIPEAPFELLVRRAIERLLPPALQCKDFVHMELLRIAEQCLPPDVARFPVLQTVLGEAVEEFINAGAGPAEHMIRNLVSCELAYINTSHPQFIGGNRAIAQVLERRGVAGPLNQDGPSLSDNQIHHTAARPSDRAAAVGPASFPVSTLAAAARVAVSGAEPELFHPDDLLVGAGGGSGSAPSTPPRPGLAGISGGGEGPRNGWFSGWFGAGRSGQELGGGSDPGSESVLKRPPPVRIYILFWHLFF